MKSTAGNNEGKVRSDCFIELELTNNNSLEINIKSKVKNMFGDSIEAMIKDIFMFFEIKSAKLNLYDYGALNFVIAARVEASIKKLKDSKKEYLLDFLSDNKYSSKRNDFRFSRLYLPGNKPSMMLNAGIHKPNGIILDLEDSVALEKKQEARFLIRNVLRGINFYGTERMVRINQGERGLEDLNYVVPHNVNLILLPKVETINQIKEVENKITNIKQNTKSAINKDKEIYLMPIIESALGVENAYQIATSSKNIVAMAIGLEDFTADIGVQRTKEAKESLYARTRLVNACKAAKLQAIDSVFSDVADEQGLRNNIKESSSLGFEGMGCIHPRQIPVIHEEFAPKKEEIVKAIKIVKAFDEATKKGLGVVAIGSKMIDPPVVKRALTTVNLAKKLNLIS